jgi:hypothetical protein
MVQWFFMWLIFIKNVKNISEKNIISQFFLKHSPQKYIYIIIYKNRQILPQLPTIW